MQALAERRMMPLPGGQQRLRLFGGLRLDPPFLGAGDQETSMESSEPRPPRRLQRVWPFWPWPLVPRLRPRRLGSGLTGECRHGGVPGWRIRSCKYFTLKAARREQNGNGAAAPLQSGDGTRYYGYRCQCVVNQEFTVAPRAYWKGYLRLSLVSCPIALYPATSEREKISFHQINKETGNRIRYRKVDAGTGDEVSSDLIVKGFEVAKGEYIEITDEELESVALESTKTIDIDEFVPQNEIDVLYDIRPYYIAPDGKVGQDAFVVIRNIIEQMKMVAIGRIVLTSREHVIAITPRGKGLMGTLLRFPYEVRDPAEYFDDIPNVKLTKDMMDLARHIVETKTGHFKPEQFEDHYEHALKQLIEKKAKGEKIEAPKQEPTGKVINLMDALRRSVQAETGKAGARAAAGRPAAARKGKKRAEGQKEMLLPIAGKKSGHEAAREEHHRKPARNHGRQRKAG
jgi:DNA end-binding protein Ku